LRPTGAAVLHRGSTTRDRGNGTLERSSMSAVPSRAVGQHPLYSSRSGTPVPIQDSCRGRHFYASSPACLNGPKPSVSRSAKQHYERGIMMKHPQLLFACPLLNSVASMVPMTAKAQSRPILLELWNLRVGTATACSAAIIMPATHGLQRCAMDVGARRPMPMNQSSD
jgi:hypothetical protein